MKNPLYLKTLLTSDLKEITEIVDEDHILKLTIEALLTRELARQIDGYTAERLLRWRELQKFWDPVGEKSHLKNRDTLRIVIHRWFDLISLALTLGITPQTISKYEEDATNLPTAQIVGYTENILLSDHLIEGMKIVLDDFSRWMTFQDYTLDYHGDGLSATRNCHAHLNKESPLEKLGFHRAQIILWYY